jgi:ketosteroid isomerase-like protein
MPTLTEDRDAIRDLYSRYCLYIDSGAAEEFALLFTDDGVFEVGDNPVAGHDALKTFAGSLPPGSMHHMITDHVIKVDGDRATCCASSFVTSKGQLMMVCRTRDDLERVGGTWKIAHRTFTPDPE